MNNNSLIIPVYYNQDSIPALLKKIEFIYNKLSQDLEVLFVVDGSPDRSYEILRDKLPKEKYSSKIILLSRNFGELNAIRTGLELATGKYFAVMSADLQEPSELIINFFLSLKNDQIDLAVGVRESREDPFFSKLASYTFWYLYRKFIFADIPKGGVDLFGCNKAFRDTLLKLKESNSSLIAQLFWLGFRRKEIKYKRLKRVHGTSQWNLKKKIQYMLDCVFSFTDIPIKILSISGLIGLVIFSLLGFLTFIFKILGFVSVPGYTSIFLSIGLLAAINIFGLGVIGSYAWRAYENTKHRPLSIILKIEMFS